MIPDDEPWWMVRRSMQGDGSLASETATQQDAKELSPGSAEHQQANIPEPTDFRPIGYEW